MNIRLDKMSQLAASILLLLGIGVNLSKSLETGSMKPSPVVLIRLIVLVLLPCMRLGESITLVADDANQ